MISAKIFDDTSACNNLEGRSYAQWIYSTKNGSWKAEHYQLRGTAKNK